MTSPEVNVGSIIARVALDTTGLKKGEAESTASLKRTATGLEQTATQADKVQRKVNDASTAIKRNTDTQVDAIRRTSREQQRAGQSRRSESVRGSAARGSVAGVVAGQLITEGLQHVSADPHSQLGAAGAVFGGVLAGGAIGSVAGPVGAVAGGLIGGGVAAATHRNDLTTSASEKRAAADRKQAMEEEAAEHDKLIAKIKLQTQLTDQLGKAQLRVASATQKWRDLDNEAPALLTRSSGIVSGVLGGEFDEHARMTQGDVGKAMDKVAAAQERLAKAEDRLQHVRSKSGSKASLLSAEGAVASAKHAVASRTGDPAAATLRLAAAEQRLDDVRKRARDPYAVKTAEQSVADAREAVEKAQAAAAKAGAPKALDVKTLLSRQKTHLADVTQLDKDTRALVRKGLREPVIEELLQTEKEAPGTVHKVASSITKAQIVAFNRQQLAMDRAAADLIKAPLDRAYADARADAQFQANALAAAQRAAYQKALSGGQSSPNLPIGTLLAGKNGDPLYNSLFSSNPAPPSPGNFTPRQDPDTRRSGRPAASVTITGPVTVQASSPKALITAIVGQTRVNALSRP